MFKAATDEFCRGQEVLINGIRWRGRGIFGNGAYLTVGREDLRTIQPCCPALPALPNFVARRDLKDLDLAIFKLGGRMFTPGFVRPFRLRP